MRHLAASGLLRTLLVLLCLPLALLALPGTAQAATLYGGVTTWSVSQDILTAGNDGEEPPDAPGEGWRMTCSGTAAYANSGPIDNFVVGSVKCKIDVEYWSDPDPGDLKDGVISVAFNGTIDGTQDPCTYAGPPTGGTGDAAVELLESNDFTIVPGPTRCVVDEVCVDAHAATKNTLLARYESYMLSSACSPLSMGPLPFDAVQDSACKYGTPIVGTSQKFIRFENEYVAHWNLPVTISGAGNGTVGHGWNFAFWVGEDGQDITRSVATVYDGWPTTLHDDNTGPGKHFSFNVGRYPDGRSYEPTIRVLGVEAYYNPGDGAPVDDPTYVNKAPDWDNQSAVIPRDSYEPNGGNYGGITDPGRCRFWFGNKVTDVADSVVDEPWAPVPDDTDDTPDDTTEDKPDLTPPDPTSPTGECDFSWTDPSTWLSGGMCLLVKKVTKLIDTVIGLPGRIADAILDGLAALFVPEHSFQYYVRDVKGDFEGRFPFNFGETVDALGLAPPGSGKVTPGAGVASGGCPDWTLKVGDRDWSAVCDSSFTAKIRDSRPFILAGMLAVAFWPFFRSIFYASLPLIKPAPGGDK